MDDIMPIIIMLVVIVWSLFLACVWYGVGKSSVVDEMAQYGCIRIDGTTYILQEVINNDKF